PVGFGAAGAGPGKGYRDRVDNGTVVSRTLLRWAWYGPGRLDRGAMRTALAALHGAHDCSAFCAAPGREVEPTCRIRALHVRRRKAIIAVSLSADRFLHHMVRNIVGSALEVGRGARPPGWLAEVLASRDRTQA